MKFRILAILLQKELLQLKRNPFLPRLVLILPVMVMLVMPLVANMDIKDVGVAVVDNDDSILSRRIVSDMDASQYLTVVSTVSRHDDALRLVENGAADAIVSIPSDYSNSVETGRLPEIEVEANGVNSTKGMLGANYAAKSAMSTLRSYCAEKGIAAGSDTAAVMNRYNPTLDFRNYMIPALMVILIIIICGFLPALNLVSEKEKGTIEAINVTPVGRLTFVLSKLIPYWAIGIMVITVGMLIGWLVYGLVPQGSIGIIYLAAILFSLVMSALGVTISNSSSTIMQSIFVMFAIIMIFQIMGGMFTPISSMPQWAQYITYAIPPRYFIEIMRSVYLKGSSIADLSFQLSALAAFAVLLCTVAAVTYRKRS